MLPQHCPPAPPRLTGLFGYVKPLVCLESVNNCHSFSIFCWHFSNMFLIVLKLYALCFFLQGQRRRLCLYDYLDLGEVEENVRRAQSCKKHRHIIVDPELAKLVTEHLGPDLQDAKTVIIDCNPGMFFHSVRVKNRKRFTVYDFCSSASLQACNVHVTWHRHWQMSF